MMNTARGLLFYLALTIVTTLVLQAQQTNVGNINGTVRDASGAAIPDAKVLAINQETNLRQETSTSRAGEYRISLLPIGIYSVSVSKTGFSKTERTGIPVIAAQTFSVDFELEVGAVTQVVTVTSAAPILDITTTNQGTTRTTQELGQLPVGLQGHGGRNAAGFIKTMAGVSPSAAYQTGYDWMQVSRGTINGIQPGQFGYQIEGLDAGAAAAESGQDLIAPTPDEVEEVRLTSNVDASMGNNGGVSLAMTLKSGTNSFHGSVYYYGLNDALNARSFFDKNRTLARQHEPGFAIGGPVIIPHVYNGRNKTFFFTTIDVYRDKATVTTLTSVPTALMHAGDFSQLLGAQVGTDALGRPILAGEIYDPATTRAVGSTFVRDPFMYNGQLNVIPPSQFSSVSQGFQKEIALPNNGPGLQQNWVGPGPPLNNVKDQWVLKVDQVINDKHRVSVTQERVIPWFLGSAKGTTAGLAGHSSTSLGSGWVSPAISSLLVGDRPEYRYRLTYVWTISPSLLFNFRAGITREHQRDTIPLPVGGPNYTEAATVGLKGTLNPMTPWVSSIPGFFENGQGGFGPRFGAGFRTDAQRTPFGVDWTWSKGSHTAKLGIDYQVLVNAFQDKEYTNGIFSFTQADTGLPNFSSTGAGYASYLLGAVGSAQVGTETVNHATVGGLGLYAQDKWRMTPKVTVDYGLRWDLYTPMHERQNRMSSFDPSIPNPAAGGLLGAYTFYGVGPGRNGLQSTNNYYFRALGPRFGIAYAPNPKTVFRATFGITYYPYWQKYLSAQGSTVPSTGFSLLQSVPRTNNLQPVYYWDNPFPLSFPPLPLINPAILNNGAGVIVNRAQNRPPMVENFGFEIGRELPHGISLRVGYVGTMAHRIEVTGWNLNTLPLEDASLGDLLNASISSRAAIAAGIHPPYPGFSGSVSRALAQFPQMSSVAVLADQYGNSTYNSLQVNVQKQFGDLAFLGNYTASKMLTNVNNPGYFGYGAVASFQHPSLLNQEGKQIAQQDRPQIVNLSWVYTLPFGAGKRYLGSSRGLANQLVSGWRLSAIQRYAAGYPLGNITTNQTIPGVGGGWPVRVLSQPLQLRSCGSLVPGDPSRNTYLNRSAFTDPVPFTLGNTAQLPNVRQCGVANEDLGIEKDFPLQERTALRFGTIWQNVFNRHYWTITGFNIDQPPSSFAKPTGVNPGRNVQFFVKVDF